MSNDISLESSASDLSLLDTTSDLSNTGSSILDSLGSVASLGGSLLSGITGGTIPNVGGSATSSAWSDVFTDFSDNVFNAGGISKGLSVYQLGILTALAGGIYYVGKKYL